MRLAGLLLLVLCLAAGPSGCMGDDDEPASVADSQATETERHETQPETEATETEREATEVEREATEADRPATEKERAAPEDDDRPAPEAEPPASDDGPAQPVAYSVPRGDALRLDKTNASRLIDGSPVVAKAGSAPTTGLILFEWLEAKGVKLDQPKALQSVLEKVGTRQQLSLIAISAEHRAEANELARLHPSARELRSFYANLAGSASAETGQAMLEWLRVFRRAMRAADDEHVVLIPIVG